MKVIMKYHDFKSSLNEAENTGSKKPPYLNSLLSGISDFLGSAENRFKALPGVMQKYALTAPPNKYGTDPLKSGFWDLLGMAGQAASGVSKRIFKPSDKTNSVLGLMDIPLKVYLEKYKGAATKEKDLKEALGELKPEDSIRAERYMRENPPIYNEDSIEYVTRTFYSDLEMSPGVNRKIDAMGRLLQQTYINKTKKR